MVRPPRQVSVSSDIEFLADMTVYDTTGSTVQPVYTAECQQQDTRERPLLSTFYHTKADIPPCPDEHAVQAVNHEYGMVYIPPLPRAWIPPPQPMPYNPWAQTQNKPSVPPSASGSTSSSFRPRNPPGQLAGGTSSAYRPRVRGASAPALDVKPDLTAPNLERRTSVPTVPKVKSKLYSTNSNKMVLDREGVIRKWRKEMKPRKSALLNPLSAQQVGDNMANVEAAPPFDYGKCNLPDEKDEEGGP